MNEECNCPICGNKLEDEDIGGFCSFDCASKYLLKLQKAENPNYLVLCVDCGERLSENAKNPKCEKCRAKEKRAIYKQFAGTTNTRYFDDFVKLSIKLLKDISGYFDGHYHLGEYVEFLREYKKNPSDLESFNNMMESGIWVVLELEYLEEKLKDDKLKLFAALSGVKDWYNHIEELEEAIKKLAYEDQNSEDEDENSELP